MPHLVVCLSVFSLSGMYEMTRRSFFCPQALCEAAARRRHTRSYPSCVGCLLSPVSCCERGRYYVVLPRRKLRNKYCCSYSTRILRIYVRKWKILTSCKMNVKQNKIERPSLANNQLKYPNLTNEGYRYVTDFTRSQHQRAVTE